MRDSESGVGVAIIRTVVEAGQRPVIRILQVSDLFGGEHLLAVTTSQDEALQVVALWLRDVVEQASGKPAVHEDR